MSILHQAPEVPLRGDSPLLLLDADYLAYMLGALSEREQKDDTIQGQQYVLRDEDNDIYKWIDPIELVHWKVDNEIDKLLNRFDSGNIEVWLTPPMGNFRDVIAVSKPYKGSRTGMRPYHYDTVRNYLVNNYGASVAIGCEADDMVCTRQMDCMKAKECSVIIGPDKDLRCMFGWHYNPNRKGLTWVTWDEAFLNFCGQLITGDSVDNIPGCRGRGPKFWDKLKISFIQEYEDIIECFNFTHEGYLYDWMEKVIDEIYLIYLNQGHDAAYFHEQANLLHMRRKLNETVDWELNYDWMEGYTLDIKEMLSETIVNRSG